MLEISEMTLESDLETAMARTNDFTVVLALVRKFKLKLAKRLEAAWVDYGRYDSHYSQVDIEAIIAELRK